MAEELTIKVGADVAQALAGLGQVHGKVGDLDQAAQKAHSGGLGGLIGGLGSLISPATLAAAGVAAVGATLFDSVGKAGEFGQKMAEIRATMQPTGDEMQKLHGLALDLGKANDVGSVSAKDAADAIFELGKSGVSAEAQLGGVTKATLQLAAAAGPDFGVANAAALAGDTLNTFGLDASHATEVVNDLVGAANASSTGLQEMKYSFAAVGPVAAQMGFSVYDTAEAFALFANHGLKGSDAGTSLKTMMLNLHPTTKTGTALMKELGLITKDGGNAFFDAHGKVKDFNDIAGIMRGTFGKLNPEMQAFYAKQIFGTDAVRAVAIMSGSTDKELNKLGDDMEKQGNAAKVAADMNNNFKGKMEALGGTIDTIKIRLGRPSHPRWGRRPMASTPSLAMRWPATGPK
jgi:TP901 family phage tail tape measure protein